MPIARPFRFLVRSWLAVSFIFVISSAGRLHLVLTRAAALLIVHGLFDLELFHALRNPTTISVCCSGATDIRSWSAMDLPVDRQERWAALNAILKPFLDRAVAACAHARQASLRSDADNEKFAKAQMEGGYWLAPLKEAADYWAVEAARLQIVAHEAAQTAHGAGGRSSSPSAARRGGPRTPRTT
jgi:hypothetical protein